MEWINILNLRKNFTEKHNINVYITFKKMILKKIISMLKYFTLGSDMFYYYNIPFMHTLIFSKYINISEKKNPSRYDNYYRR